jgi:hypothetical protein
MLAGVIPGSRAARGSATFGAQPIGASWHHFWYFGTTTSRESPAPFKNQGDCIQYVNTGK